MPNNLDFVGSQSSVESSHFMLGEATPIGEQSNCMVANHQKTETETEIAFERARSHMTRKHETGTNKNYEPAFIQQT